MNIYINTNTDEMNMNKYINTNTNTDEMNMIKYIDYVHILPRPIYQPMSRTFKSLTPPHVLLSSLGLLVFFSLLFSCLVSSRLPIEIGYL